MRETNSLARETRDSMEDGIGRASTYELAGELGLGSSSSDWMDVRIAETSYVGLQRFCKEWFGKLCADQQAVKTAR